MLNIDNLTVARGKEPVLVDLCMRVDQGELVTLLGANGAGKSSLLQTISGMLKPRSGSISLDGEEISSLSPHQIVQRGVIQVPEGRQVFPELTVQENLRMGAFTRKDDPEGVARDMEMVFSLFPRLKERLSQDAGTLSGGEAQMLAVGRGLLSAPRLFMLDEPSLGLAPVVREMIFHVISQIHSEKGLTVLLVEQNASWALQVATRAYILENGRVVMQGLGRDLIHDEHVKRAYLGH
ncbi:MAG TPA: ABC transporter ATP-binding protein [Desulfomonilaceae bacterium]|nr:ABC transporter ATP-binding protein [Desulfomonilaceae bacterium]